MRRLWLIFAQATTVALAVVFVLQTLKPGWLGERPSHPQMVQTVLTSAPPPEQAASGVAHPGYALAARRAAPAVVSITTSKLARSQADEETLRRLHRGILPRDSRKLNQGLGSGVIVSPDGYLLTNNHVIEDADDIEVRLTDGRQIRATLIGSDPETDVAVLKIKLDRLPVIRLGNADALQVGDAVLAIGNPFNVGQTVTSGIVSALGRSQLGINTFENFIQTDAAINPGNSGGALVDTEGNLIGINTAILSRTGGSNGVGFAIPITTARQVMEALLRDGQVERGWIGVQTRELTPEFAEAFKLPVSEGVLVSGVLAGAPAAKAGVKPGDVLTKIGSRAVMTPADLLSAVAALNPQSDAVVSIQRGAEQLQLHLTVGLRPHPTEPEPD
ncbi:trypsin-like peptidase domain-containing protein [Paucibacter sp. R3-3]|uniref:Trypsin-like peptidase domain-containing protein n=1 Tax=Roseateles agri TaxID=3098619 RepID=A0ABU5DB24_9BURK|nr:trypsin-like peptidase domain-containing protein [Paucibacter sp. R3-3]MDY0743026.1 trypsin-like peptidase domain-containing protein [Paucibacter sp. R3-3]